MFAELERRRGRANLLYELLLGGEALRLCLDELIGVVVVLEHVELDLGLRYIETSGDCLLEAGLGVRKIFVGVLRISEDADMSTTGVLRVLLRDGMQVEHRPAGDQKLMDVAQGVHDALTFDSSQGPGEEREVETPPRDVDLSRTHGSEGDAIREVEWQSPAGSGDLVGIGIDGENAFGRACVTKGQPAVTAPKLEHTEAVQRRKAGKCVGLGTLGIDPRRHARIMANAASRSRRRAAVRHDASPHARPSSCRRPRHQAPTRQTRSRGWGGVGSQHLFYYARARGARAAAATLATHCSLYLLDCGPLATVDKCSTAGTRASACSPPVASSQRSACSPPDRLSRAPNRVPAGSGSRTGRRSVGLLDGGVRARWTDDGGRLTLLGGASLLSFGAPELAFSGNAVSCRYAIQGGLLALRAGGSVTLAQRLADDEVELSVIVEEYLPRLAARLGAPRWTGTLYAKGQSPLHAAVSRRYFEVLASRASV